MEEMLQFFPLVLYILGIMLLVILIIIGVKLIHTVNRANDILDDAYNKSRSLNGLFGAIDSITDTLSSINDTVVSSVAGFISKFFHRKKKKKKEEYEDYE